VVASALGAAGLEYRDVGLNSWGVNSMPSNHIHYADLLMFCEMSGIEFAELLPPGERELHTEERADVLDLLRRARSALLESDPDNPLVQEISRVTDNIISVSSPALTPKEEPLAVLAAARLPPWMRQRI
jgi:hypothetical protein